MNISDEGAVLEILSQAQLPLNQLDERTMVNARGRVTRLRLAPCLGLDRFPSVIRELSHLEELYLFWGGRSLSRLPTELFQLPNLKVLHIRRCHGLRRLISESDRTTKHFVCNLEELIVEGCQNLTDLSCLMGRDAEPSTASSLVVSWPKLSHLHVIDCPQANFVDAFQIRQQQLSGDAFPSLLNLSLRKNLVTGADLGQLWPFFVGRCPNLASVDLSDNQINSLEDLVSVAIARHDSSSASIDAPRPSFRSLRRLNLAGNPVLEKRDEPREADDDQDADRDNQVHLIRLLRANPQLCSIVRCDSGQPSSTPASASNNPGRCFVGSALYSSKTQHALDLNYCSRGERTLQSDTAQFPLAMWPLVLERANVTVAAAEMATAAFSHNPFGVPATCACHLRHVEDCRLIHPQQRQASLLYTLLQGPVFASRGVYS